ncbi:bifunctional UDP-sugar hydrolase/5'-nucleotidase [Roseomonas sp. AR75]|uniref:bifunctional metallophosphatase/5'-nucleotidase n=1 Tax=Roseomonas sp. AR75 TaxID=2562311 RepID=UPI0010C13010|nr:5'-nucleotidase C-terminal domain-containing protein [Roseomonas sp. AR75]
MPALRRRTLLSAALALPALRPARGETASRVSLLHLNDFHSRHEGGQASGANCRPDAACLGGSARLVAAMKASRAAAEAAGRATLALDAGDQFMGSLFYTYHRGLAEAAIQQAWGCEAMALGNHEFDNGPANAARYIRALGVPVLSANVDTAAEPALDGLVRPLAAFVRGGARIVVIGLTTEETPFTASPGPKLRFRDSEEAAERAIAAARAEGPATVVLLSHRGLPADMRLAERLPGVDVIVGGHSHTVLANRPDAAGPAPTLVEGRDRTVRIVQAGAFGRFVGRLDLDLDAAGRVVAHRGEAEEITPTMPEDAGAAALVARFAAPLAELRARPVAQSAAELDNAACRTGECALGNLIAEAMLAAAPGADIALQNGGGIRTRLPGGTITYGDVLAVLPFGNTLATATIRGATLLAALENGLSQPGAGRFPQIAGLRIEADLKAPAGSRLVSAEVLRGERAGRVDPERAYRLVTNNFLRLGGDGYAMLRDAALESYDTGPLLEEVFAAHLATQQPVAPRTDGRIGLR